MPSINHSKAWDRLSTLTSFVSRICFSKAHRSDSDSVNECIVIPPNSDFTRVMVGIVKKIMSTYLCNVYFQSWLDVFAVLAVHVLASLAFRESRRCSLLLHVSLPRRTCRNG